MSSTSRCSSTTTDATEFEEHLEGLAEAVHERIRLRLIGPVAPYDFVGGRRWD